MDAAFWHNKWEKNEIGFHQQVVHSWMSRNLAQLGELSGKTIFVPLCGKTLDIAYLLEQGLTVIANELSELAVIELFASMKLTADISDWSGHGKVYRAEKLTVYVGDYFELTPAELSSANYVYDRAAIIALPLAMRQKYGRQMMSTCGKASQLIMTLDYNQAQMSGPPFSVAGSELEQIYSEHYSIKTLVRENIIDKEPRFKQKGLTEFNQSLYLLNPL
mgnify:CR=1 FL=1